MDLGTDNCYAGVPLAPLKPLTQGARRMLGRYSAWNSCLLARCLLNEGATESSSRQAITPARYDEGTLATNHNAATGETGYHNTSPP